MIVFGIVSLIYLRTDVRGMHTSDTILYNLRFASATCLMEVKLWKKKSN